MPRRSDSTELTAARDKLRTRFEAQQASTANFFAAATRAADLRLDLDKLEAEQRIHAAALADTLDIATAADVTGWSRNRIIEAQRSQRTRHRRSSVAGTEDLEAS